MRPIRLLCLLLTLGLAASVNAQEQTDPPPWYQVELFIFTQPTSALDSEFWSETVLPRHSQDAINLVASDSEQDARLYAQGAFRLLDAASHDLPLDPSQFRRGGYRPLFRGSWRQPLLPREESRPIRIRGGQALAEGLYELEGEIRLDIARYLHLRTDLYFTQAVPADWQSPLMPPASAATPSPSTPAPEVSTLGLATVDPAPRLLSVNLKQERRMRSGQLHYLDHPMFGLMVKLSPWEPPQATSPASEPAVQLPIPVESPALTGQPPQ
ncbi:CsiV family protein [Motiliproteus sp. SC1-56]|uniref:CsiV family protein n=1 Tax=Motiliproteus sp. SC1-56 TaxID=2799565 RepID=UPI001A8D9402|nr:CsiV family protein [Motiliproteus sp. SC1-56]